MELVEHANLDNYRFDTTNYSFFTGALILQKLAANCRTKVLNLLIQLELEKILANSKLYCLSFFWKAIKFYLVTFSFVIVY